MPNTHDQSERAAKEKIIVVIGGGPVGCVAALYLQKRGYHVHIFEMRPDPRNSGEAMVGKSINITLSNRGLSALDKIGIRDMVCECSVKCFGRLIHDPGNKQRISPYSENNEHILSVSREVLYRKLVAAVDECPNITIEFDYKLTGLNFEKSQVTFHTPEFGKSEIFRTVPKQADVILGCDGANSCVRKYMNREGCSGYKEESIDERYVEFNIPATCDGEFAMEANYLHIWARNGFLLLALPNKDCSFTATLFMPTHVFESLKDASVAREFVYKHFPDAVPLIGEEKFVSRLSSQVQNAHPLMWVKCTRFHHDGKVLLLGDAAHAMVPFYGQGINCGFEGVSVLDKLLDRFNDDFEKVFNEFSETRIKDTNAMCDLSLENYNVLKSKVNTWGLSCRMKLDRFLHWMFPNTWVPLYTMVAFSDMRYSECLSNKQWQDKIVRSFSAGIGALSAVGIGLVLYYNSQAS